MYEQLLILLVSACLLPNRVWSDELETSTSSSNETTTPIVNDDQTTTLITRLNPGEKALEMYLEYQNFIFPDEYESLKVNSGQASLRSGDSVDVNTHDNPEDQYYYVAALGYVRKRGIEWNCAGAVISERFILTSAHCTGPYPITNATVVYLGAPVQGENTDPSRMYKVKRFIKHPGSKRLSHQDDIALVETETPIKFNAKLRPACLHTGEPVNYDKARIVVRDYLRNYSWYDFLETIELRNISKEECFKKLSIPTLRKEDFVEKRQLCYRHEANGTATCHYDAGTPVRVRNDKGKCKDLVVGIASLRRECWSTYPNFFTRVAPYLSWIASIAWP